MRTELARKGPDTKQWDKLQNSKSNKIVDNIDDFKFYDAPSSLVEPKKKVVSPLDEEYPEPIMKPREDDSAVVQRGLGKKKGKFQPFK